ncbi:MAG: Zn-ribbon domain-containing OB-fold protein [Halobacteriales archaeon]|nr:Zn-ribbon domain-containing OB-fold protein [Halobacteriales archaeon]
MSDATERHAGFDEFLDAIEDGEGYYMRCPNGHGSLPPRRACPECGSPEIAEEPLPDSGTVETFTVVHVGTPHFADDAPYVTAIAAFDSVRITGVLRGVDPDDVETGIDVEPTVEQRETNDERLLVFRPH